MSIEAYNVAVKISLVENVTRGLMMMGRHFKTTDAEAKILETRLKSIGKLAMGGAMLAGAGAFGLAMFKAPIEASMEYERRLGSLRQMGLGDAQIADAKKFVDANKIIGESINDRMRLFVDAQGSFRQSGMSGAGALGAAKTMMPVLATYEAATKMLAGEKRGNAEMAMRSLNKPVEMMGGLNDTNRARAIADGVFKAAQSSGGMVDERQLKQFVAYGSSATNQLGLRTIFGGMEPIIGELGGSTTGVGLRTAYTRTNGMMALMPRRLKAELARLGMADKSGKQQTDSLARLQATDVIGYAQEMMRRYAGKGITSRTDIERENAIIFGTNGSKVFNKIMSQMPVLQESLRAYDKASGASGVTGNPANRMLKAQMDLEAKEADLKLHIGQVVLPLYVRALEMTAGVLDNISSFATKHPTAFKMLVEGFAALSAAAVVGGGIMLFTAGLRGIALIGPMLPMVGTAFRVIAGALPAIIQFGMFAVESLVAGAGALIGDLGGIIAVALGPVGLVVGAIGVAGYLIYRNWSTIGPMLGKLWDGVKSGVFSMINYVIGLLNHLPGVHIGAVGGGSFVPGGSNRPEVHVHNTVDRRGLTSYVTYGQALEASKPSTGGSGFDPTRARPGILSAY